MAAGGGGTGGQEAFRTLSELGVRIAFGLPGTQSVPLYEALRTSSLRSVVTTHELAATFAAIGHYRACGRPAAVLTMPGAGLTYALTGVAEARHDSAAVLLLVTRTDLPGTGLDHQEASALAAAAALAKDVVRIEAPQDMGAVVAHAFGRATTGEPGPVVVQMSLSAVEGPCGGAARERPTPARNPRPTTRDLDALAAALRNARRVVLVCGQGAADAGPQVARLASLLSAPVVTTSSGRGAVPEDEPSNIGFDPSIRGAGPLPELLERADLILAIGCKGVYAGSGGLRTPVPLEKAAVIEVAEAVRGIADRCRVCVEADATETLAALVARLEAEERRHGDWDPGEIAALRERVRSGMTSLVADAPVTGDGRPVSRLLSEFGQRLPHDACLVTDSGLHQMLVKAHVPIRARRGLLTPANFQSMGFALPAAIGACLACPDRRVVAVIGDGGLAMSGLELRTAVREGLHLLVVVLNDRGFGLIRRRQLEGDGVDFAVDLEPPDPELLAAAVGASFTRLASEGTAQLEAILAVPGVHLVEVSLGQPAGARARRARNRALDAARARLGRGHLTRLRHWLGRPRR